MNIFEDFYGNRFYEDPVGQYHNIDGPAVEYTNGNKWWYKHGKLHRINGPAIEKDGEKFFFIEGVEYSEEEYNNICKQL